MPAATDEWALGKPDFVLRPQRVYSLSPGKNDVFRNLVIRTSLPADRFVRAIEFRPGDAPVHHAVLHLDDAGVPHARWQGWSTRIRRHGAIGTQDPDGHFIGWAPGRGPIVSAEGRPWRLARGPIWCSSFTSFHKARSLLSNPRSRCTSQSRRRTRRHGAEDGLERDRHSAGCQRLRNQGPVHASGRRHAAEPLSPCAFPWQGHAGPRFVAGRKNEDAAAHSPVELPLAAGLPLQRSRAVASGHDDRDALHLRQLRCEQGQPKPAPRPRRGRAAFHGRNGKSAPAGGACFDGRSRAAAEGRRRACGGSEPGDGRTNGPPQSGQRGAPDITRCELHRRRPSR